MDKELEAILMTMLEEQRRQGAVLEEVRDMAAKTAMKVEGEVMPKLQALADGYVAHADKLEDIQKDIKELKSDMGIVKLAVTVHDEDIRELKAIK